MATGFAYYHVANVDKFIEVYTSKAVDDWRRENGCVSWRIFRFVDEPTKVAVMAEFPSIEAMQAFRVHPKTRQQAMEGDAGIQGTPTLFELETVKKSS